MTSSIDGWKRMGKYFIGNGNYRISKALVGDEIKYTLWHDRNLVDTFFSVEEAKRRAQHHANVFA